jgi:hypothetical protein
MAKSPKGGKLEGVAQWSNDGDGAIGKPYVVEFTLEGTSDMLFHRWSNEDVEAKSKAAKNSRAKKEDNLEAYIYRNDKNELCIPGEYVRQAMIGAAKYRQDPRSPRKSAMDLFKAGIVSLTDVASLGLKEWDYTDKRRVMIQRNGVTRTRPAVLKGWRATLEFQILLPEYIEPQVFQEVLTQAGRLIGVGDFRPTYGRFSVVNFEVVLPKAA